MTEIEGNMNMPYAKLLYQLLYYTMHFIKLLMAHYSRVYTLGNSTWPWRGRGGGQVVSVLAYLSGNPRSNPAEVQSYFSKIVGKKNKYKQTEAGVCPF